MNAAASSGVPRTCPTGEGLTPSPFSPREWQPLRNLHRGETSEATQPDRPVDTATSKVCVGFITLSLGVVGALLGATVALVLGFVSVHTARVRNAFETARQWDTSPTLQRARRKLRKFVEASDSVSWEDINANGLEEPLIYVFNFYWDIGAAIDLGLADERYLKKRFRVSFRTVLRVYNPFVVEHIQKLYDDPTYNDLQRLADRWDLGSCFRGKTST